MKGGGEEMMKREKGRGEGERKGGQEGKGEGWLALHSLTGSLGFFVRCGQRPCCTNDSSRLSWTFSMRHASYVRIRTF